MSDPLNPATQPASMPPPSPVPRLSRRLAGGLFLAGVAVLSVLVYAIFQRADPARQPEAPEAVLPAVADAAPSDARSVVPGYRPDEQEIPAAPEPDPPEAALLPPPLPPEPPGAAERRERIIRHRDDLFRDALVADTTIAGEAAVAPAASTAEQPPFANILAGAPAPAAAAPVPPDVFAADGDPNLRSRKDEFSQGSHALDPDRVHALPPSPYAANEIRPGTIIPALLVTGINTDLPGQILAQVARDVRDTLTGDRVLIPRGSRLVGTYDSHVAFGQRRALVSWSSILLPDGSTVPIDNMPGADPAGLAGFRDRVNNHYLRTFAGATMLSVISAGAQLSQPERAAYGEDGRRLTAEEQLAADLGRQWAEVGEQLVTRNLDIQPSLTIRPGYRFRVVVTRDLVIPPWREA